MGIIQPRQIYPTPTSLPRNRKSTRVTLPPPVGGWNTRDDPVQMALTDATHLVNFYPEVNEVAVRRGFTEHATGVGAGDVDTVAEFYDGSVRKLLAASSSNIYDATTAGAASSIGSGFTSGQWQTAIMNGVMGLVNGADAPQDYDGTTLGAMTISGVGTATEIKGVHIFKNRSYFWKGDSPSFWYSALNTLGGACTEFALGEVAKKGGSLVAMTDWSVDGGAGPDDYAVFILSSGEVLVYQGDDPGTATDWALVGSYQIPSPLGIRAVKKIGGQVAVLTDTDIVFLPRAFDKPSPPSSKLSGAIEVSGPAYRNNFGWQMTYYGTRKMLLMNIPVTATQFEQYVVNLESGAPARFTEQNARSWTVFDDELYFGSTDGKVYQADVGSDDNGANINADGRQAWSDLGIPTNKRVEAFRMVFSGTSGFSVGAGIGYDFTNAMPSREVTTGGSGTPWGSPWGSPWGASQGIIDDWQMGDGYGQVISPQVSIGIQDERPVWYRTDLIVKEAPNI